MTNGRSTIDFLSRAASSLLARVARSWSRGADTPRGRDEPRSLVEISPDAIARYGPDCRGIDANRTLLRAWGIGYGQFERRTPTEVPGGGAGALLHARIEEALATGREDAFEYRLEQAGGAWTWTHVRLVPERGRRGRITGVLAIGRDVSVLKEAAQALEESRERLRRLAAYRSDEQERERKRLAHGMHEDLAQILAVLGWELKQVGQQMEAADPHRARVDFMATLADRALRSVLSTVDSIRPTTLGLGIVPALGQLARHFEDAHGIPCVLRAQGPGPAMTEERATMTYRMAEALLGTIAERPGTERVELSLATGGTNHLLSVRDRNPAGPAGAVGESIGLVVVQEFAWRLGGEVVVIDEQGGRMVEVTIPAESGAHAAPRPASRLAEAGSK